MSTRWVRPIIAKCANYKDKQKILKEKKKLKDTGVFINEDYTHRVRETRRKLGPFIKQAREAGKLASMVYDHLIIDGERYDLAHDSESVVRSRHNRFPNRSQSAQSGHTSPLASGPEVLHS